MHILYRSVRHFDAAAGDGRRCQQRSGDDAVGHRGELYAVKLLHALDDDGGAAGAPHATAHAVDEALQIDDLRFPRSVMDNRHTRQTGRRHHDVFRRPHAGVVEMHLARMHMAAVAADDAALLMNPDAQRPQAGKMQIDRAQADLAAAGICNRRLTEARENRTKHEYRRTDLLGQLIGHFVPVHVRAGYADALAFPPDAAAQHLKNVQHPVHIGDLRHAMKGYRLLRQHTGRQNRQRSVLRAVCPDAALQPSSALDDERFRHVGHLRSSCFIHMKQGGMTCADTADFCLIGEENGFQ